MKNIFKLLFVVSIFTFFLSFNVEAHTTPVTIKMTSNGFEPQEVSIDSDTSLIFENVDTKDHWPASDLHPTHDIYPEFDPQKPIKEKESWKFRPTRVGTFKYHDHLFPHHKAVLKISGVVEPNLSTPSQLDLKTEVDRIINSGKFVLKGLDEDVNSYLRSQMDYCFKNGGRDYCYKDLATILTYQYSLPQILELLKKNESHEGVFARCHELTHYLTRLAYQREKNISTIYDQCTSVCHGGCYHGAIEQYLLDKKISLTDSKIEQEIPKVCGPLKDYKIPLLRDECIHGIGHGTMYITDSDLIASLRFCDLLEDERDRHTCYSGAFMENSSSSTNLDHPSKFIKADDPMYPCNILDKKYLETCYRYQSSYFAIITQSNWTEVAKLCLRVPKDYQKFCFLTIGSNLVGFTQDLRAIADNCKLMPINEAKDACYTGVVDALAIRYRGDFQRGVQFCSIIDSKFQSACFKQFGASISSWSADPNNKTLLCDSIGNLKYADWCKGKQTSSNPFVFLIKKIMASLDTLRKAFAQGKTNLPNLQVLTFKQQLDVLKEVSSKQGSQKAWQYLVDTYKAESGSKGSVHDFAHFMGGLIFEEKGFEGLGICSSSFAFGCFHGFLDRAFKESLSDLPKAEKGCKMVGNINGGPYASCIHGIGHGVASFYSVSDIKEALSSCEKLSQGKDYCYDGVFMEFSRNASSTFYKADNPLYPCDQIEEKYISACGRNQPNVLMQRFKYSFDTVANLCINAQNQNFKTSCVTALGFITTASSQGKADQILASCGNINDSVSQVLCATSAAGELIFQDYPSWREEAPRVCDGLDAQARISCQNYLAQLKKDYNRQ